MPVKTRKAIATTSKRPASSTTSGAAAAAVPAMDLYERIRQRAYELYEQRGRAEGYAEQDWLQAEAELTQRTA